MSVKIRLTRAGRKKHPFYRIVVMDSRHRRDGAYIEQLGLYHPNHQPAHVLLKEERALEWLMQGAEPSDTVRSLLSRQGIMLKFDLTKRGNSQDKINDALAKWQEQVKANEAKAAAKPRRKKKTSVEQNETPASAS